MLSPSFGITKSTKLIYLFEICLQSYSKVIISDLSSCQDNKKAFGKLAAFLCLRLRLGQYEFPQQIQSIGGG